MLTDKSLNVLELRADVLGAVRLRATHWSRRLELHRLGYQF